MLSQRNTHYWLWFLLFGGVSALASISHGRGLSTETTWLLVARRITAPVHAFAEPVTSQAVFGDYRPVNGVLSASAAAISR